MTLRQVMKEHHGIGIQFQKYMRSMCWSAPSLALDVSAACICSGMEGGFSIS